MMRILIALGALAATAHGEPLAVEIKPATLSWRPTKRVDVALRVVNTSATPQKFRAWLCSWYQNVRSGDAELVFDRWGCDKNYDKDFDLAPGKAWEQKLEMYAIDTAKAGAHELRLGFTPSGGKLIWSPGVTITVVR